MLQERIAKPYKEAATKLELKEAAFSIVKASHKEAKTRPYHEQLLRWYKYPITLGEAYSQRAAIFSAANCFLQATSHKSEHAPSCQHRRLQVRITFKKI